jgi:hypothetical protein
MIYTYDLSGNYLGVELSQSRNHLFFPEKASSDKSRINQLAQRSFSDLELWAINDQILMEEYIATGGGNSINETGTNSNGELEYWAFRKYQSLNTAAPIPSGDGIAGGALYSHTPLIAPIAYTKESADIITNYNPRIDKPIQIDLGSFLGAAGKLKITKKSSLVNKLAKSEADFIYDQQAGYLYYNENGNASGFGDGGVFAILEDKPKVGLGDFNFV